MNKLKSKEKKIQMKLFLILFTVILLLPACGKSNEQEDIPEVSMDGRESEDEGKTSEQITAEDLNIDIPYGVIHFPSEFSDYTHIETEENEDYYKVEFRCKYEENNILLFSMNFGKAEEGAAIIGQLMPADDSAKDVSIRLSELSLDTEWAEKNSELLYSMQEAVNYVIQNFESSYEFRPVE